MPGARIHKRRNGAQVGRHRLVRRPERVDAHGMPRPARLPGPDAVDLSALAPNRVAAVADLVAAGMSSSTIARRVRSQLWQRPASGTIVMQSGPPSRDQLVEVALTYTRPDGVVSGVEALRRHGMRRLPETEALFVLIGADRRRTSSGLIVTERTARLPEPWVRDGVAVAPLERAAMDTARHTPDRDQVRALLAEVVQRRRSTVARLRDELAAGTQRGSGMPREVLSEIDDGVRSASEGWGRMLLLRSTLPPAMWNASLFLPSGRFLAKPDAFFDDVGLAWEVDSLEFHPEDDDTTARRRADLVEAGVVVVHHRPTRLRTEPERVIDELWSYYRLAAARPRPDVRAVPQPRILDSAS